MRAIFRFAGAVIIAGVILFAAIIAVTIGRNAQEPVPTVTPAPTLEPLPTAETLYFEDFAPLLLADCAKIPAKGRQYTIDGYAGCKGERVTEIVIESNRPLYRPSLQNAMIAIVVPADAICDRPETLAPSGTVIIPCRHSDYGEFAQMLWYEEEGLVAVGVRSLPGD